jgi:hypothetical protein
MHDPEEMVPRGSVAREWNVCTRSVARWEKAKIPGFDEPIFHNGRVYHRRKKLELAKRGRLSTEEER